MIYQLKILFFGGFKAFFDAEIMLQVEEDDTIDQILIQLLALNSDAEKLISVCAVAVDGVICSKNSVLGRAIEMALLPPFSGG